MSWQVDHDQIVILTEITDTSQGLRKYAFHEDKSICSRLEQNDFLTTFDFGSSHHLPLIVVNVSFTNQITICGWGRHNKTYQYNYLNTKITPGKTRIILKPIIYSIVFLQSGYTNRVILNISRKISLELSWVLIRAFCNNCAISVLLFHKQNNFCCLFA